MTVTTGAARLHPESGPRRERRRQDAVVVGDDPVDDAADELAR